MNLFKTKAQSIALKLLIVSIFSFQFFAIMPTFAASQTATTSNFAATRVCGKDGMKTTIDIGCKGKGNPIVDLLFAIIRFLVVGATVVITGSLVVAGIQYTSSGGSPEAISKAKKRITSSITALFILIFGYAILNYLIPVTILK